MLVKGQLKYLRIAPRKVRLAADLIRGKKIKEAQSILRFTVKRGADSLSKLLKSVIADAEKNFQLSPDNLYISKITIDGGPIYKRWRPRSRGMAYPIQKKTSHVNIILDEIKPGQKIKKQAKKESGKVVSVRAEKSAGARPKFKPQTEKPKPISSRGLNKIFRRKSI